MRRISQRELRNESGDVMREVARGASFEVTSRGMPVAVIAPISARAADEHTLRPATRSMQFPPGAQVAERTEDVLRDLRSDR